MNANTTRKFGLEIEINGLNNSQAFEALSGEAVADSVNQIQLTHNYHTATGDLNVVDGEGKDKWIASTDCTVASEIKTNPSTDLMAVAEGMSLLKAAGANVSGTNTGCHVNIDARNGEGEAMSLEHLKRLVLIWTRVEQALFSVVAPSRRSNHYCEAIGNISPHRINACDSTQTLLRVVGGRKALNLNGITSNSPRIEFRLHQGTLSGRKIGMFTDLLCRLVDRAQSDCALPTSNLNIAETVRYAFGEASPAATAAPRGPRLGSKLAAAFGVMERLLEVWGMTYEQVNGRYARLAADAIIRELGVADATARTQVYKWRKFNRLNAIAVNTTTNDAPVSQEVADTVTYFNHRVATLSR